MPVFDCYKLLGIPPDADEKTIRKAWRAKTKEFHPDVNREIESSEGFLQLREALEILLDPVKRLQHDRALGYYEKPRNQDRNAKQDFSEFQKSKAESLVNEWKKDYGKVMQMREEQRQRAILHHKRRMKMVFWLIAGSLGLLVGGILFFVL